MYKYINDNCIKTIAVATNELFSEHPNDKIYNYEFQKKIKLYIVHTYESIDSVINTRACECKVCCRVRYKVCIFINQAIR